MTTNAPGRAHRQGMSLVQVVRKFNTEAKAERWFVAQRWQGEMRCPRCDSDNIQVKTKHPNMPHRCRTCRKFFSVRLGTPMQDSNLPLSKWAIGLYLYSTNLKGVSSMKLHRDLDITQKSAWHMAHRIREMYDIMHNPGFAEPAEIDETYIGGATKNKPRYKRKHIGGGPKGKEIIVGIKDRDTNQVKATHLPDNKGITVKPFITDNTSQSAVVYSDDSIVYYRLRRAREVVNHSTGEFVRGMVHTNGIESFWSMLKRGLLGVYHHVSVKHLQRYTTEFAGRHNQRQLDTEAQMGALVISGVGKRLRYADLIGPRHTRQPRML